MSGSCLQPEVVAPGVLEADIHQLDERRHQLRRLREVELHLRRGVRLVIDGSCASDTAPVVSGPLSEDGSGWYAVVLAAHSSQQAPGLQTTVHACAVNQGVIRVTAEL